VKSLVKALLPKTVWRYLGQKRQRWFNDYGRQSYSQEGEDMIIERFLENRSDGFYVDVGAHHPIKFSNTYRLYRRGWRGLNIDANPGSMAVFRWIRPRDINVEAAASSSSKELTYYIFNEPALNTFNKALALERQSSGHCISGEVTIMTSPLWQLLDQYVPPHTKIDLLTVDVEGLDYDVLLSNDWGRYSPEFILAECIGRPTLDKTNLDPIAQLLSKQHYLMIAKTMYTVLFRLMPPDSTASVTATD
jgi:FkbM family methyltransferase